MPSGTIGTPAARNVATSMTCVPEADVREPEAAADQPAVAEQPSHLLGRRIGRDVEVLRLDADQEVAHAAADEEGLVARVPEAIEDLEGVAEISERETG